MMARGALLSSVVSAIATFGFVKAGPNFFAGQRRTAVGVYRLWRDAG